MAFGKYWKLRREAIEIWLQIKSAPEFLFGNIIRFIYDLLFNRLTHQYYSSVIPETDKIALFVIHQPKGIAESVFLTVDHLVLKGYSILLVSNGKLSTRDIQRLQTKCWYVLIRPNIGYDFGGYRDGMRLLNQITPPTKLLLLMNDSIWYPIIENDDLLERLENMSSDFSGPTLFGENTSLAARKKKYSTFLASFMMLFKTRVTTNDKFWSFWKYYRFSNNKRKTMRRGERGLSEFLKTIGHQPTGLLSKASLETYLKDLSLPQKLQELRQVVVIDPKIEQQRVWLDKKASELLNIFNELDSISDQHINEQNALQAEMMQWFDNATAKPNFITTAPVLAHVKMKIPYLKKRTDHPAYLKSLQTIFDLERENYFPKLIPVVKCEINEKLKSNKVY